MKARSQLHDQDLHAFIDAYREAHPEDVEVVEEPLRSGQELTALAFELLDRGRWPMLVCSRVAGLGVPVITNMFASRDRIARILGCGTGELQEAFHAAVADRRRMRPVEGSPLQTLQSGSAVDLSALPMIDHFPQDAGPYWTSAIVIAENPAGGGGNASYHRCMRSSPNSLATSLHSRGHLWRYLAMAEERRQVLPVAVVLGGHPLFMLASSARVSIDVDEREIAGGLFGTGLEVVPTPRYGIAVPATAEYVLEGFIDPSSRVSEGPFGEYSGYASDRSTNNLLRVEEVLRRPDPVLLDVVSGHSPDHLNLGRVPREADLLARLRERFPDVAALHFPTSGTHFHCFVSLRRRVPGQGRQLLLALLGLDPYVKMAVVVDDDIDPRREAEVHWAVATRFQADRDLIVLSGLPGSLLDPSSSDGTTARMGLDATKAEGFEAERLTFDETAVGRVRSILDRGRG